jgi:hypothetical protein
LLRRDELRSQLPIPTPATGCLLSGRIVLSGHLPFGIFGGGANGAFTLDSATVIDDGVADTLIGDGGLDWFLTGTGDKIKDRSRNEQVN